MTRYYYNYTHHLRSFSENIKNTFLLVITAGILFLAGSCEEDPSLVGSKLLPGTDFVTIKSGLLKVQSHTMYSDSIQSGMPSISYLGKIYDPYFGSTTAEFVSQLRLGAEWEAGFTIIDSMKLFLQLLTVEGDTASNHYLRLSEIADELSINGKYYSGLPVEHTGYTSPDILLPPLKADEVNYIVLNVDTLFGRHLIRTDSMLTYDKTPDFRSYFRGLHFQMISPDNPVFVSLSVAANTGTYNNYFMLYLKNKFGTTKLFPFRLDAATANAGYNVYKHNFDTASAPMKVNHINDQSWLDSVSYVQTFNGVYTKLILTNLDSVKNSPEMKNVSVNKARLKIPVVYDGSLYRRSTIPAPLYLRYYTTTGPKYLVPEIGTSFYNGYPDTTGTSEYDDVYTLNIASFVQKYFEDKADTIRPVLDLFLIPSSVNNAILRANDNNHPVKFEFTYTKF